MILVYAEFEPVKTLYSTNSRGLKILQTQLSPTAVIYLKSAFAGVLAVIAVPVILSIGAYLSMFLWPDLMFGWHVHYKTVGFWVSVAVIFSLGFAWEHSRLSK